MDQTKATEKSLQSEVEEFPEEKPEVENNEKIEDQQSEDEEDDLMEQESEQSSEKKQEEKVGRESDDDSMIDDDDSGLVEEEDQMIEDDEEKIEEKKEEVTFKKLSIYPYQSVLFQKSKDRNSIIYLPTGSGKTMVSILSMYYYLCKEGDDKKIIFLANTIQLVKQQAQSIKKNLEKIIKDENLSKSLRGEERTGIINWDADQIKSKVCCIHGEKNEDLGISKRKKIESQLCSKKQILEKFRKSTIIVMIAQMFLNSLRRGFINITDFSFVVFDECHHCSGDHPFMGIMRQFYFEKKKEISKKENSYGIKQRLPVIMGLTASPVDQPHSDKGELLKNIQRLSINLDSTYTEYEKEDRLKKQTLIQIKKVQESEKKQFYPYLINHFSRFRNHQESYNKIQYHFPEYFECVQEIIELLGSRYEELKLKGNVKDVKDELYIFYDIKECLLQKLRDLWLQLGEFAFQLGFKDMVCELEKIKPRDEKLTDLYLEVINKLRDYMKKFIAKYGQCQEKFFSGKVNALIEILHDKENIQRSNLKGENRTDMVLIFSSKRRTVKYLESVLQKYQQAFLKTEEGINDPEEGKKFDCKSVTGYSSKSSSNKSQNEHIFVTDPSSKNFQAEAKRNFGTFRSDAMQHSKIEGESANLTSQMQRILVNPKYGKLLLEIEEKYTNQIKKISEFRRKEFRILITTSVTEEGFDIPECNTVISFDMPMSLKSYIQIKGRARKQNSKYYILTSEQNYETMKSNQEFFDSAIRATFQIAINKLAKETEKNRPSQSYVHDKGYKKINIKKTGAIINTNFALQILKTYFSSLKQPNKPKFYFLQTPNVCFKCIIYFPESALVPQNYVIGDPESTKEMAQKSAAYRAVIELYKSGFIKNDLRPKKYEHLEQQRELQRYNDIQQTRKNEVYRQIFENHVKAKIENEDKSDRKFIRYYFRSLANSQLDFPEINPEFKKHIPKFQKETFKFQVYRIDFSNTQQIIDLKKEKNQVGILTCFPDDYKEQIFNQYFYSFEENEKQNFSFKLVTTQLMLDKNDYQRLKDIHEFLIAASQNREHHHYSLKANAEAVKSSWIDRVKKYTNTYTYNKKRQFFPLIVLLQKQGENDYVLDEKTNKNILDYEQIFTEIYRYHNCPSKPQEQVEKLQINLTQKMKNFKEYLDEFKNGEYDNILVQSLEKDFCFHKCLIQKKEEFSEEIEKKQKEAKHSVVNRHKKMARIFLHVDEKNIGDLIKIKIWRKYKKEKKNKYFRRGQTTLIVQDKQASRFYCLSEFYPYPLSTHLFFKVNLATEFVFKAYKQYSLAFKFRNIQLTKLFASKLAVVNKEKPYKFEIYPNIVIEYEEKIFAYLAKHSGSRHLRNLGQIYRDRSEFIMPEKSFSVDPINLSNISTSFIPHQNRSVNQSMNVTNILHDVSGINESAFDIKIEEEKMEEIKKDCKKEEEYKNDISLSEETVKWKSIKIKDILKVLTSKMYKFNRLQNYEEYEFIGDVVLKMLSTVEVFLQKPEADESQLHIKRANIICNANLHRKAIIQEFFKYILTKKNDEFPPPFQLNLSDFSGQVEYYPDTKIQKFRDSCVLEGFKYIPGKVHADVVEALIGAVYLRDNSLLDCQALLYSLNVLKKPNLDIIIENMGENSDSNFPKIFEDFEHRIQYSFKLKGLLIQALTHSSFKTIIHNQVDKNNISNVLEETSKSELSKLSFIADNSKYVTRVNMAQTFYERLQFLGDSILDLIVVQYLHQHYKGKDEGTLTLLKQAGVSNKTLGMIALNLGMHELILMEHPENDKVMYEFDKIQKNYGYFLEKPEELVKQRITSVKILGDVFEALVGAIFIDNNMDYSTTKAIMMNIMETPLSHFTRLENIEETSSFKFQKFLKENNYRDCQVKKDTTQELRRGMFKFDLIDWTGSVVDSCYEINEKKAWDVMIEKFMDRRA